jgi:hypothetical protein
MALVFAVPFVPTAPPRPWIGLGMTWTGWDGSLWNLTKASEGVVMLPGLRGLTMPPVVHYTTAYPTVSGARWRGHAIDPREVFWPIQIFCDTTSQAWVDRDRAFWKTMRPDKTGMWTVTQPSGQKRYLMCRFDNDGESAFQHDPVLHGWSNYGITMKAKSPFWLGDTIVRSWADGAPVPFFPTAGEGFRISPGSDWSTATMTNPGDVPAWPVWELTGPLTTASVGLDGYLISVPFDILAGQVLIINSDPTAQTATLYDYTGSGTSRVLSNPVDKTMNLGSIDFCPVPAQDSVPITLTVVGSGKVTLRLTPLYLRAW